MRHPAGELAAVERPRHVGDEPAGVEVEVELGVGGHAARRRRQCGDVGEAAEHDDRQPVAYVRTNVASLTSGRCRFSQPRRATSSPA